MGLGFIRHMVRRPHPTVRRRPKVGRYFPPGPTIVISPRASMPGAGTMTAAFTQSHVMTAAITGAGDMSVQNGTAGTAVTLVAPQINPSSVTIRAL